MVGHPVGVASGSRELVDDVEGRIHEEELEPRPAATDPRDVGDLHIEPRPRIHDIPTRVRGVVRRPVADPVVDQGPDHDDLACVSDEGREPQISSVVAPDEKAEVQRLTGPVPVQRGEQEVAGEVARGELQTERVVVDERRPGLKDLLVGAELHRATCLRSP